MEIAILVRKLMYPALHSSVKLCDNLIPYESAVSNLGVTFVLAPTMLQGYQTYQWWATKPIHVFWCTWKRCETENRQSNIWSSFRISKCAYLTLQKGFNAL